MNTYQEIEHLRQQLRDKDAEIKTLRAPKREDHEFIMKVMTLSLDDDPRRALSSDIRQDCDQLWEDVNTWVQTLLDPILDSTVLGSEVLTEINSDASVAEPLFQYIDANGDLKRTLQYQGTDEWVLTAIIIRFLVDQVFEKGLHDLSHQPMRILHSIENAMRTIHSPPRTELNVQIWRRETYAALNSLPEFTQMYWKPFTKTVIDRLRGLVGFLKVVPGYEAAINEFEQDILSSAIKIHKDMVTSMEKFWFEFETYDQAVGREARVELLLSNLKGPLVGNRVGDVCVDILGHFRTIQTEKISRAELKQKMDPLVTKVPRIRYTGLGGSANNFAFVEDKPLNATETLVAYGTEQQRHVEADGPRAFLAFVYQLRPSF
ncbi:hypothetical protein F5Y19DRAFT_470485 [Xylariaceae sp. FL1651]|nr:hypothetical protein F5Y19DRAFT_470485 [Xylariaceae sp. FL1651]